MHPDLQVAVINLQTQKRNVMAQRAKNGVENFSKAGKIYILNYKYIIYMNN